MNYRNKIMLFVTLVLTFVTFTARAETLNSTSGDALAVEVRIDKTDENAVKAKEKAMIDAKREALTALSKRVLSAEDAENYKLPEDQVINTLIKDFEVKNEKLSTSRYIADFTIRFNDSTVDYIRGRTNNGFFNKVFTPNKIKVNKEEKTILVLPFYKDFYGKNLLWEDPNPWRDAWQALGGMRISSKVSVIIPTGDIDDISFGSSQEIWQGMSSAINDLKTKYSADEVLIASAYKHGKKLEVEMYQYGENNVFLFKKNINTYLPDRSYQPAIDSIIFDKELFKNLDAQAAEEQQKKTDVTLKISMFFNSFKDWMEVQKRINAVTPKVEFKILSLNNKEVDLQIDLPSEEEHLSLKDKFKEQGLILTTPDYNFDGGSFNDTMDKVTYNYVLLLRDY